jgi:hypothetical protein
MRYLVLSLIILMGIPAEAGPWPRDKGAGFLSFSVEYDDEDDSVFTAAFAEYGITSEITGGLDLGFADDELYKAVAFARCPLATGESDWLLALEMGIGTTNDEAVLRPGLHFGRALKFGKKSGWFTIESYAYYEVEQDKVEASTDITLGFNMTETRKLILQLQNGNQPMDPDYLNLASSMVIETTPGLHVER